MASKRKYTKRAVAYVLIGASLLGVSGAFAHPVFSGDYSVTSGTVSSINESTYRTNGSASRKSCTSVVTFNVDGNTYTAIDDSSSAGSCLVKIGDTKEVRYNRSDIEGTASAVSDHTVHLRIWGTLAVGLSAITAGVLTWRSGAPTIVTRRTDGTFTTKSPKK